MYRRGVPHGGRGQRQEGQQEEGGGADAGQAEAAPAGGECYGAQAPQDGDDQEEEQEPHQGGQQGRECGVCGRPGVLSEHQPDQQTDPDPASQEGEGASVRPGG